MNVLHFSGNVGRDAELRNAGGTPVAGWSVAMSAGYGARKQTVWLRCSLWGKRAESAIVSEILKGRKITGCGELSIEEYQGKTNLEVRILEIDFPEDRGAAGQREVSDSEVAHAKTPASKAAPAEEIDEDVLF